MNNSFKSEEICSHNSRYVFETEEYFDIGHLENVICRECQKFVGSKYYNNGGSTFLEGLDANDLPPNRLTVILPKF